MINNETVDGLANTEAQQNAKILSAVLNKMNAEFKRIVTIADLQQYIQITLPQDFGNAHNIDEAAKLIGWKQENLDVENKKFSSAVVRVLSKCDPDESVYSAKMRLIDFAKSIDTKPLHNAITETIWHYILENNSPCVGANWVDFDFLLRQILNKGNVEDHRIITEVITKEKVSDIMEKLGYLPQAIEIGVSPTGQYKSWTDRVFIKKGFDVDVKRHKLVDHLLAQMTPHFRETSYPCLWTNEKPVTLVETDAEITSKVLGDGFIIDIKCNAIGYDREAFKRALEKLASFHG